jgi:hypothetical protein
MDDAVVESRYFLAGLLLLKRLTNFRFPRIMVAVRLIPDWRSMHLFNLKTVLVGTFSSLGLLSAATSGIGVAMSEGNILINSSAAAGNATIFNGSTLETQTASSQVHLNDGGRFRLASDSRGMVFSDHADLQKGSVSITGYSVNASGLSVRADGKASATVSMRDQGVIEIAALTGSVHVFNRAGMNVANLVPGRELDLRTQDAGTPSNLTGCAVKSGGNTLLTDETSNVTVQLMGADVRTGRRVQVTGSMVPNAAPISGAAQIINVGNVKEVGGACKTDAVAAGAAAAGAATAGGAGTGVSTAVVVVASLAGATGVGLGIAAGVGAFSSNSTNAVSRGRLGAFN